MVPCFTPQALWLCPVAVSTPCPNGTLFHSTGPVAVSTPCPNGTLFHSTGPVAVSTTCKLIAPGVAVNGTMSITKTELYFEMDEEDAENKKMDPKVGTLLGLALRVPHDVCFRFLKDTLLLSYKNICSFCSFLQLNQLNSFRQLSAIFFLLSLFSVSACLCL